MDKKYITRNFKETQKLGKELAHYLSSPRNLSSTAIGERGSRVGAQTLDSRLHGNDKRNSAIVLALQGDLGGGKTTFLQGFAKGLGIKEKILSPTFVIMRRFVIPAKAGIQFYHFDCYRLKNDKEILELGFKEIISDPKNVVAIEWPERIRKILPKNALKIKFKFICPERSRRVDEKKREIFFNKLF